MLYGRLLTLSGLIVGMAACASAPDPMLYTLSPIGASERSGLGDGTLIGLSEITLPSYARNQQITTAISPNRLTENDDHRWASPPSEAISEYLSIVLESETNSDVLVRPYPSGVRPELRLTISFSRLLRRNEGGAELAGQYIITGLGDDVQVSRFDIGIPSKTTDYFGYMEALSEGLDRLGGVIADRIDLKS
ncbi:MAG: PqiC family protein [Pseudomonadota bacterium]